MFSCPAVWRRDVECQFTRDWSITFILILLPITQWYMFWSIVQPSISGMDPPFGDAFQNYTFADQALISTDLLANSSDPDFSSLGLWTPAASSKKAFLPEEKSFWVNTTVMVNFYCCTIECSDWLHHGNLTALDLRFPSRWLLRCCCLVARVYGIPCGC